MSYLWYNVRMACEHIGPPENLDLSFADDQHIGYHEVSVKVHPKDDIGIGDSPETRTVLLFREEQEVEASTLTVEPLFDTEVSGIHIDGDMSTVHERICDEYEADAVIQEAQR